jgi:hypothetical protein
LAIASASCDAVKLRRRERARKFVVGRVVGGAGLPMAAGAVGTIDKRRRNKRLNGD